MKWQLLVLIGINSWTICTGSFAQEPMSPGSYKAPLRYAVQLPPYCFGTFFGRTEPQYQLPSAQCGPFINHFCSALVFLMQAREAMDKNKKVSYLERAERAILYTKDGIANPKPRPQCPMNRDVAKALAEAQAGLMVFRR